MVDVDQSKEEEDLVIWKDWGLKGRVLSDMFNIHMPSFDGVLEFWEFFTKYAILEPSGESVGSITPWDVSGRSSGVLGKSSASVLVTISPWMVRFFSQGI